MIYSKAKCKTQALQLPVSGNPVNPVSLFVNRGDIGDIGDTHLNSQSNNRSTLITAQNGFWTKIKNLQL